VDLLPAPDLRGHPGRGPGPRRVERLDEGTAAGRRRPGRGIGFGKACSRRSAVPAAFCRPSSSMEISRMRYFWILPVTVMGNPSVSFQ
jgi:hypothetical protein